MNPILPSASILPPSPAKPKRRLLSSSAVVILLAVTPSCIQPPPPRTYRPEVARRLDRLAHGTPVTPLPDPGANVWESFSY